MEEQIDQKIIEGIEAEYQELVKKNGLQVELSIDFPKYRELPDYLLLAVKIIENEGGTIVKKFSKLEIPKEEPKKDETPKDNPGK